MYTEPHSAPHLAPAGVELLIILTSAGPSTPLSELCSVLSSFLIHISVFPSELWEVLKIS